MTQKIRAINIANNTFKNFVFDSAVSSLINTAAVAYSTANAANALAQAANTVVVSQASQAVAPTINTISITDSSYNVIDDTAANTGGAYLRITGSGFQTGATVLVGTSNTALSTTFVNSSTLRSQIGPISSGTYPVYVVNTNGGTAIRLNGLTISSSPIWGTGSTLANVSSNTAFSGTLSANSDSSVTYANTTILPTGFNLASNGYYYGNISVGLATTYSFDVKATDAELQDQTRTFSLTAALLDVKPTTVEYLVVAGGGGGGSGSDRGNGGGGAGGFRTNINFAVSSGSAITVTVGAGGSGTNGAGTNGSDSVFSTISSAGGGCGASRGNPFTQGQNGGSGGGADHDNTAAFGLGNSPAVSPSQGNNGGSGYNSGNAALNFGGGGGGGASTSGGNASSATNGSAGVGGNGTASSISGSSITYAGGGGGGAQFGPSATGYTAGTGGSGGGGNGKSGSGGSGQGAATPGTINTGGGGGGACSSSGGGNGGSGVVIISYPTAYSNASSTTGASYTSIGGKRIYTWTSSGSITF